MSSKRTFGYSERGDQTRSLEASMTPTMVMATSGFHDGVLFAEPESVVPQPKRVKTMSTIAPSRSRAQTAQTFASRASGRSAASSRPGAGIERFRSAARKIIHMHRGSRAMSMDLNTGAEPGIDARNADADGLYGHIRARCLIDVVDYSSVRSKFQRFDNVGFLDYLEDERANRRDEWAKVRWINVVGISWDVMSALAIKYGRCRSSQFIVHLNIIHCRHPPTCFGGHHPRSK